MEISIDFYSFMTADTIYHAYGINIYVECLDELAKFYPLESLDNDDMIFSHLELSSIPVTSLNASTLNMLKPK